MYKALSRYELVENIKKIPEFELKKVFTAAGPGDDGAFIGQPKFKAAVEKDRDGAVAVVSDKYALLQIREIFDEALRALEGEVSGKVCYYGGRGQLHVFPEGSTTGICIENSVDRSSAVRISFIGEVNGATVYLPGVSKYRRLHVGKPVYEIVNFEKILAGAQETWGTIAGRLSQVPVTEEHAEGIKEGVGTKRLERVVDEFTGNGIDRHLGRSPTLWDLLLVVLKAASASRFKSEIHRQRRLKELSNILFAYALKEG